MIRHWFAKRPRFHVHFTPTYGSWLNFVERWFAKSADEILASIARFAPRTLDFQAAPLIERTCGQDTTCPTPAGGRGGSEFVNCIGGWPHRAAPAVAQRQPQE